MNPIIDLNTWIAGLGGNLPDSETRINKVLTAYHESHRRYHSSTHLFSVINWLRDRIRQFPDRDVNENALMIAALYHDVVFIVGAKDNEEKSAEWAAEDLRAAGVSMSYIARVVTDIMDTRHMGMPPTTEGKLMVDADLISMSTSFEHMYANTLALLEESDQSPAQFAKGNIAFISSLLARPAIFRSAHMEQEEARARQNISRVIECLKQIAA